MSERQERYKPAHTPDTKPPEIVSPQQRLSKQIWRYLTSPEAYSFRYPAAGGRMGDQWSLVAESADGQTQVAMLAHAQYDKINPDYIDLVAREDERKEITKISLLYEPQHRFAVVAYKHTGELTKSVKENWERSAGVDFTMPMKNGEITPADMERIAGVLEQGHVSPELTQKSEAYFQEIWHAEPLGDASRSTFHRVFPPADHA